MMYWLSFWTWLGKLKRRQPIARERNRFVPRVVERSPLILPNGLAASGAAALADYAIVRTMDDARPPIVTPRRSDSGDTTPPANLLALFQRQAPRLPSQPSTPAGVGNQSIANAPVAPDPFSGPPTDFLGGGASPRRTGKGGGSNNDGNSGGGGGSGPSALSGTPGPQSGTPSLMTAPAAAFPPGIPLSTNSLAGPSIPATQIAVQNNSFSHTQAATTTAIATSSSSTVYEQSLTITATVTSTSGTPSGGVTFYDGNQIIGAATISGNTATFTVSNLAVGSHTLSASYDGSYAFATSSASTSVTVAKADTTTSISALPVQTADQPAAFVATVTPSAPGAGIPTGSVTFYANGTTVLATVTLAGGTATYSATGLTPGTPITAQYSGDNNFNASTSSAVAALADPTATFTADNHYILYEGNADGSNLVEIGRNEAGAAGNPGVSNWSLPETFSFNPNAGEFLYAVAWDGLNEQPPDGGPQMFIGQVQLADGSTLVTDTTHWQYVTGGTNPSISSIPSTTEVQGFIAGGGWAAPQASAPQGTSPWGTIPGISSNAQFIWSDSLQDPAASDAHYVIFRTQGPITNDPPVAVNDTATTNEDAPVTINVLANDSDADGDSLQVLNAGNNGQTAQGGTVQVVNNQVQYTPKAGFVGTDTFSYTMADSAGWQASATVTVTVTSNNDNVVATLTADNHYGLFIGSADGSNLTFIGRNEVGAAGNPGAQNWSLPETFNFEAGQNDRIYVVAWDALDEQPPDGGPQAFLGQFQADGSPLLVSDTTNWESIVGSGANPLSNGAVPPTSLLQSDISQANANSTWAAPAASLPQGSSPWGTIPGISSSANFIWPDSLFDPAASDSHYVIFRTTAPVLPAAQINVTATQPNASEGTPAATPGTFTFTRTGSLANSLTANYTVSGSAASGTDFTPLSGSVTFAAGQSTATVTVTPKNDMTVEPDETVVVTIAPAANYQVGSQSSATVTIHDIGTFTAQQVQYDPTSGNWFLQGGNITQNVPLVLSAATVNSGCTCPTCCTLTYNSATVSVQPIIQATIPFEPSGPQPTSVDAALTWNNGPRQTITNLKLFGSGSTRTAYVQLAQPVQQSGLYNWSLQLTFHYASGDVTRTVTGSAVVVTQDNSSIGRGWSVSIIDKLLPVAGGIIRVLGSGGFDFYTQNSNGSYTSQPGDSGVLVKNVNGSYTYTTPNGDTRQFNTDGLQTLLFSKAGQDGWSATYNADLSLASLISPNDHATANFQYVGGVLTSISRNFGGTYFVDPGDITQITDPDGRQYQYSYDSAGHMLTSNYGGQTNTYTYQNGQAATVQEGSAAAATITPADLNGGTAVYTDPNGNTTRTVLDAAGRVLQETDALGNTTRYTRDANGYVTSMTDALGRTTTYAVDAQGYVLQQTNPDGGVLSYEYNDPNHQLTKFTDANGNVTTYTYDSDGRQLTMTDALGNTTTNVWSSNGDLLSTTDANGHETQYFYDSNERLIEKIDAAGGIWLTSYDANGFVASETDPLGRVTSYVNDPLGRVLSMTDALSNVTAYSYDSAGRLATETDALGRVTQHVYNDRGLEVQTIEAVGTAQQRTTTNAYDAADNLVSVTDALGHTTSYGYDAENRQIATIDALGNTSTTQYDAVGNVIAETDANGHTTRTFYDSMDRPIAVEDALGNVSETVYDHNGNVVESIDALGRVTRYTYDADNRQVSTIDPLGGVSSTAYDAVGNVLSQTDANGHTTAYQYDALDRQVKMTDALGGVSTTSYDAVGNVLTQTDQNGHTTSYQYDSLNRQVKMTDALGNTSSTAYDAVGNVLSETDANGHTIAYQYDALNRQVKVTDAAGGVSTTAYDAADNVTSETDANGHTTSYLYDADNRQISTTDALGNTSTTAYDAVGNVISETDANHHTTSYQYDALDRQVKVTDALGGISTTQYDAVGNVVAETDANGHSTLNEYDAFDRQVLSEDALGNISTTTYDAVGNVLSQRDANRHTTSYQYDALNRQVQMTDAAGGVSSTSYDAVGNVLSQTDQNGHTTSYQYDAENRQISTTDALGFTSSMAYDAVGNEVSSTDALGRVTQYQYDSLNRQVKMTDAAGGIWLTGYDAVGNTVSQTDANGHTATYQFDADNRQVAMTDALGNTSHTAYDAVGNVVSDTDANGHTSTYHYDALDRQVSMTDALGNTSTTAYDAVGNVIGETDANGHTTTYQFDADNRQVKVTDALGGVWLTAYDAVGNTIAQTDALGRVTESVYDALDRQVDSIDALGGDSHTAYDAVGNVTSETDANGHTTSYLFDADNRQIAMTDALANTSHTAYDAVGNVTAETDALGEVTQYQYDSLNRQVKVIDPLGFIATTAYDAVGNVTSETDANGHTVSYQYDADNRQIAMTDALGNTSHTAYDAVGNVIAETDMRGFVTHHIYDADNREIEMIDPLGFTSFTGYDAVGNVVSETDANGHTTTFQFDALNRQVSMTDALGNTSHTGYDAVGNVLSQSDPLGDTTHYVYDALNRQIQLINALGNTTTTDYDLVGNVLAVVDPLGNTTTYRYDALNREVGMTDPLGHSASMTYDAVGRLTSSTDRDGRTKQFVYDADGRLLTETWFNANATIADVRHFTYDAVGNMLTASNNAGTYTMTYDADNRLVSQTDPWGLTLTFGYDADSNQISVSDSQGSVETSVYDGDNRLTSRAFTDGKGAQAREDFTYTPTGMLATDTRFSDLAGTTEVGASIYVYDADDRVINIQHSDGSGNILAVYSYSYDAASRLISKIENGVTTNYAYDALGELTQDGSNHYSYDANENRTNPGYVTGANNELATDGTWNYYYDNEGNLISKVAIATGETWTYAYDLDNHLTSATDTAPNSTVLMQASYTFDAFGNRIQKVVSNTGTVRSALDGVNTWADLNTGNHVQTHYVWGDQADQLLAVVGSGHQTSWELTDRLGSIRVVTDSKGKVKDQITYDAFGVKTSETNAAFSSRFGWEGIEFDQETGLNYDHARDVNTGIGRFMQEDPVGVSGENSNLYPWVGNDATDATDPSGQQSESMWSNFTTLLGNTAKNIASGQAFGMVQSQAAETLSNAKSNLLENVPRGFQRLPGAAKDTFVDAASGYWNAAGEFGAAEVQKSEQRWQQLMNQPGTVLKQQFWGDLTSGKLTSGTGLFFVAPVAKFIDEAANYQEYQQVRQAQAEEIKAAFKKFEAEAQNNRGAAFGRVVFYGHLIWAQTIAGKAINEAPGRAEKWLKGGSAQSKLPPPVGSSSTASNPTRPTTPTPPAGKSQSCPQTPLAVFSQSIVRVKDGPCFAAGTPLRTPDGARPVESFRAGDLILSRSEFDLQGVVEPKEVEAVFVNESEILNLHVRGKVIQTTPGHPFYVIGKGWTRAGVLQPGDYLVGENGEESFVEEVYRTGETETTYNLRVAAHHTYFVGDTDWAFSVWAHNTCAKVFKFPDGYYRPVNMATGEVLKYEVGKFKGKVPSYKTVKGAKDLATRQGLDVLEGVENAPPELVSPSAPAAPTPPTPPARPPMPPLENAPARSRPQGPTDRIDAANNKPSVQRELFERERRAGRPAAPRVTPKEAAEALGYMPTNYKSHGQPVFYNKKTKMYITPDVDSHIGGVWKGADSVKNLGQKKTRSGTYDANLRRIGD